MLLLFTLAGALTVALVFALSPRVWPADTASAVSAAAVICVGAGVLAMAPLSLVIPRKPDYAIPAGLGGLAIRLLLSLGVGMAYLKIAKPPEGAFWNAMAAFYLLLLAVETAVTARLAKRYLHSSTPPREDQ